MAGTFRRGVGPDRRVWTSPNTEYGMTEVDMDRLPLPEFEPGRVRTLEEVGKPQKTVFMMPFCGKEPMIPITQRSLRSLPTGEIQFVIYDNANDAEFTDLLNNTVCSDLPNYTFIRDTNPPASVDNHPDAMEMVVARCGQTFGSMFAHLPKTAELVGVLEDDIEVPIDGYEKLRRVLDSDDRVATAVGVSHDRRFSYGARGEPIVFDFEVLSSLGSRTRDRRIQVCRLSERDFGVEPIGAAHTGFWLSRARVVRDVGMGDYFDRSTQLMGHDVLWGLHVNEAQHIMAVDWSLKCNHWYSEQEGELNFI